MAMREMLDKGKPLVIGVVVVLIGVAVWTVVRQAGGNAPAVQTRSYYTTDDGQSTFADDIKLLPPFDHGGKQAVRAHVFICNGKKVVGFLSRYSANAKAALEKFNAEVAADPSKPPASLGASIAATRDIEFKLPGQTEWTKKSPASPGQPFKCPDGSEGTSELP